jgi:hypothetical protein
MYADVLLHLLMLISLCKLTSVQCKQVNINVGIHAIVITAVNRLWQLQYFHLA